MDKIRIYTDESVDIAITEGLKRRGRMVAHRLRIDAGKDEVDVSTGTCMLCQLSGPEHIPTREDGG